MDILERYRSDLVALQAQNLRRVLPTSTTNGRDFSSNDYLNLAHDDRVVSAGIAAARLYGAGSTGSRLLSGNSPLWTEFESRIARDKGTEAALIFNSGFQANSGVLSALLDRHMVVVFDTLNHASMYQGVFLSRACMKRYNHLDYDQLETFLKESETRRCLIASETVFGMDGDRADISILSELAQKYNALLYLDEAHATGLYGPQGYGMTEGAALDPERTIVMGTFSKALGSSGAYIATNRLLIDFLIQRCRSFIYSTSLSPFCIGAAQEAWHLIPTLENARNRLLSQSRSLRNRLRLKGFRVIGQNTNILPILMKDNMTAENLHRYLMMRGCITSFIRRPTSPTPRLRLALNAAHTETDIAHLTEALEQIEPAPIDNP